VQREVYLAKEESDYRLNTLNRLMKKWPSGVILRSRRRRRISQMLDSYNAEILRFAQNDSLKHFFICLLRLKAEN